MNKGLFAFIFTPLFCTAILLLWCRHLACLFVFGETGRMCLPEFTRDYWFEPLPEAPAAASPDVSAASLRPTRMGLSADAVDAMPGRWIAVELPGTGEVIRAREGFGFVTTEHTTHDLKAPSEFRVVRANPAVLANAEIARLSPRVEGWLLEIEPLEARATV